MRDESDDVSTCPNSQVQVEKLRAELEAREHEALQAYFEERAPLLQRRWEGRVDPWELGRDTPCMHASAWHACIYPWVYPMRPAGMLS